MHTEQPGVPPRDPRVGACVYLLHGLLQRLEALQPGLLASMTDGAVHDRDALAAQDSAGAAQGVEVADEALRMLRLISTHSEMASAQRGGS